MKAMKMKWKRPMTDLQVFTPNSYVAACDYTDKLTPVPVGDGSYYKIDGLVSGKVHTGTANGWYDSTGEQCTTMQQLTDTWLERFFGSGGYTYHIEKGYQNLRGTQPSSVKTTANTFSNASYWKEVAILHQGKKGSGSVSFFLLANEWKGDDIDDYTDSFKNQS